MYFVIGAIVLKFQYQKAGIEMIPNYTFWMSLPHLIKVSVNKLTEHSGTLPTFYIGWQYIFVSHYPWFGEERQRHINVKL